MSLMPKGNLIQDVLLTALQCFVMLLHFSEAESN